MEQGGEMKPRCALLLLTGWFAVVMLSSCGQVSPKAPEAPPQQDNFQAFQGRKISGIQIKYLGEQTVDRERLLSRMVSKGGGSLSAAKIDEDTKALYESGLVDDLRFIPEAEGQKVRLTMEVKTRPSFGPSPLCMGNLAFSDQKLAKASGLKADTTLSPDKIADACRNVEKFYWHHGYRQCRVTWGPGPYRNQPDYFVFVIAEGPQFKTMKRKPWLGLNR